MNVHQKSLYMFYVVYTEITLSEWILLDGVTAIMSPWEPVSEIDCHKGLIKTQESSKEDLANEM